MKSIALTCLCSLLLLSSAADADTAHVSIGGGTRTVPMQSVDALSADNSYAAGNLEIGMKVPVRLLGATAEANIRWTAGSLQGTSFDRVESDLYLSTLTLSGRLHRPIGVPGLSAFAELGIGSTSGSLELSEVGNVSASPLAASDRAATVAPAAGLDLVFARSKAVSGGLRLRAGYVLSDSLEMQGALMRPDTDEIFLDSNATGLGSVNTSGLDFSIGLWLAI